MRAKIKYIPEIKKEYMQEIVNAVNEGVSMLGFLSRIAPNKGVREIKTEKN